MSGFQSGFPGISDISKTTPTPDAIPRANSNGTLDPGWTAVAQVVSVSAVSGGDFTSIKSAIDSIVDASAIKPYSVIVYPGTYNEDPIILSPYISLRGHGSSSDTILSANNNNSHFITASESLYS